MSLLTETPLLEVRDLRIAFGGRDAVCGISFDVYAGETLALVGESGSGKSLTSLALMRLLPPGAQVSGSVRWRSSGANARFSSRLTSDVLKPVPFKATTSEEIPSQTTPVKDREAGLSAASLLRIDSGRDDGVEEYEPDASADLLTLPEAQMRGMRGRDLAMIFQEPMTALNPVMTVGAQIGEAVLAHQRRVWGLKKRRQERAEVNRRVVAAMQEVGLPDPERRRKDYPHQFSGGQRQRVLIAMALVNKPQLLIADEPTTALDVTVQAQVLQLLRGLREKHGLAMLFISHDLAVVAQVADRVAVMQHGLIVEQGLAAEVLSRPQHAYTRKLLAAAPTMHSDRDRPLAEVVIR